MRHIGSLVEAKEMQAAYQSGGSKKTASVQNTPRPNVSLRPAPSLVERMRKPATGQFEFTCPF
jgi:hypothetical protein